MRVQTSMAREGLRLAQAVISWDGKILMGRGTRLERRHLVQLYDAGVRVLEVEDDAAVEPWEELLEADAFLKALEARFEPVRRDRRMGQLKGAVRDVYLGFLRELERGY